MIIIWRNSSPYYFVLHALSNLWLTFGQENNGMIIIEYMMLKGTIEPIYVYTMIEAAV